MPATPQSPPKRMTRARSKAVEDMTKAPAKSTKIMTPAAKAAAVSRVTKRKTRADDDDENPQDGDQQSMPKVQPKKSSTTNEKAAAGPTASISTAKRAPSNARGATITTAGKATRGRPKKDNNESTLASGSTKGAADTAGPALSTRTRAGSVRSNAAPPGRPATKKKVTFQDAESDKENAIAQVQSKKGPAGQPSSQKQQGLNAKPLRRATTKTAASKQTKKSEMQAGIEQPKAEPLSPKKNAQVAVRAHQENGETLESPAPVTPSRELSKSPKKFQTGNDQRTSIASPSQAASKSGNELYQGEDLAVSVDELQESTALFTSPTKRNGPLLIASPAKRPAHSPFKGSMADSPAKASMENGTQLSFEADPKLNDSVVSKPPKRIPLTEPRKKVTFDESMEPNFKNSLFGTPAKRPLSPFKSSVQGSTPKVPSTTSIIKTTSYGIHQSPRRIMLSPSKKYTSSLKAEKSPEAFAKVHKMTPEEQAQMLRNELASAPSPFSPVKESSQPQSVEEIRDVSTPASSTKRPSMIPIRSPQTSSPPVCYSGESRRSPPCELDKPDYLNRSTASIEASVGQKHMRAGSRHRISQFVEDCESEDELQSDAQAKSKVANTPLSQNDKSAVKDATPHGTPVMGIGIVKDHERPSQSMTVLAERFGGWKGATPDNNVLEKRKMGRSMFSPLNPIVDGLVGLPTSPTDSSFEEDTTSFSQSIQVHMDEEEVMLDVGDENYLQESTFRQSQTSDASQEYGDENALPIDPALLEAAKASVATCTPARVFSNDGAKVVHTVSKVPLKPAADYESPPMRPARKTHSLSGELSPQAALEVEALRQIYPPTSSMGSFAQHKSKFAEHLADGDEFSAQSDHVDPLTPHKAEMWSAAATPARTPRADLDSKLLSGAVVFVDVHTTEGADASGIFVELLTQMGARCVKQWNWNTRNSVSGNSSDGDLDPSSNSKVGITHVVFKDGGKRTMERVRQAKGLVLCVGVGWVLDCERENKWLDEADYSIDISTIPRGGHRRRKSMEPKALSSATFSLNKSTHQEPLSPTKEFLNLGSSPAVSRRSTIATPAVRDLTGLRELQEVSSPATPIPDKSPLVFDSTKVTPEAYNYADNTFSSPSTPYFLHPQDILQQTCPPKQTQQSFFPLTGRIEDQPDETIRQRLLVARRKSLQWAPRVGSPLSRAHSFQ